MSNSEGVLVQSPWRKKYTTWQTEFQDWKNGNLDTEQIIQTLFSAILALEDSIGPLSDSKQLARNALSEVLAISGQDRAEIPGVAMCYFTRPSRRAPFYDAKGLDKLVKELELAGDTKMAEKILACQKPGAEVAGAFTFKRVTAKKETES
jgi:hypothetical protein